MFKWKIFFIELKTFLKTIEISWINFNVELHLSSLYPIYNLQFWVQCYFLLIVFHQDLLT